MTYNQYLKAKNLPLVENGDFFEYQPKKQKHPLLVTKDRVVKAAWNKKLPVPLKAGELIINLGVPVNGNRKYILIRRGKRVDVFAKKNFILPSKMKSK